MLNLHVLFADGDAGVRSMIAAALQRDAFFVARGCASGPELLELAADWRPDLILAAGDLPRLNGPGVVRRLRADPRTAPIRIVLMTERGRLRDRAPDQSIAAAGVLAKPLAAESLGADLKRFVPMENMLAPVRPHFLMRLATDARTLLVCRAALPESPHLPVLQRVNKVAHALAGAGGIYGFAGISSEAAALSIAAERCLAGRAGSMDVQRALDRLLRRIAPIEQRSAA